MALIAKYRDTEKCSVKLLHISGNSKTGWVGNVVVSNKFGAPLSSFQISAPFVDGENPYDALYAAIGQLSMFSGVEHDVQTALNSKTIDTMRVEAESKAAGEPSKKPRKKKQV